MSATELTRGGSFFDMKFASILFAAICLYGITSGVWVWVLQKVELGRIYPLMALAFVFVPLGSNLFLGESFNRQYGIGVIFIVLGVVLAASS